MPLTNHKIPKISIIGMGKIGSKTLGAIALNFPKGTALEIILFSRDPEIVKYLIDDIKGMLSVIFRFSNDPKKKQHDYQMKSTDDPKDLANSDVIIFTAGISAGKIGSSNREAALPMMYNIIKEYGKIIRENAKDALILMISNPVDIVTWLMQEETGFAPEKIIGLGTEIDAERFRGFLRKEVKNIGIKNPFIQAEVIGGHSGPEMIVPRSSLKINDIPATTLLNENSEFNQTLKNAEEKMAKEGFEIVKLLGHGASVTPAYLLEAIARIYLYDEKTYDITASYVLKGKENYYGITESCISVPLTISKGKIEFDPQRIKLDAAEQERLILIADNHKKMFDDVKNMASLPQELEPKNSYINHEIIDNFVSQMKDFIKKENKNLTFKLSKDTQRYLEIGIDKMKILIEELEIPLLKMLQEMALDQDDKYKLNDVVLDEKNKILKIENTKDGRQFLKDTGLIREKIVAQAKL